MDNISPRILQADYRQIHHIALTLNKPLSQVAQVSRALGVQKSGTTA